MTHLRTRAVGSRLVSLLALVVVAIVPLSARGGWIVTPRNSVSLGAGPVSGIRELSGVTYLGPQVGGFERFAAIQDENRRIIMFDVGFAANGAIDSATAVSAVTITGGSDFGGIAYTGPPRNSVFVSEENSPTVREFELVGGELLQSLALPDVFKNSRDNRGLEALTRSFNGDTLWTANEEALEVDGPVSSPAATNTVRLQQIADQGGVVSLAAQFAYKVEPIHAGSGGGNDRSGLPDLAMLPDDTLIALERSAAAALPPFRSRLYEVGFAGATAIRGEEFASGLADASFTPVNKVLLWSGAVGTLTNGNLEGLGPGPVLASGNWSLLGVLDNGGSGSNLIVSFELSLSGCTLEGDFNCSGAVDQADYALWKYTFGSTKALAADGNADGVVDAADYAVWRDHLGEPTVESAAAVPELGTMGLVGLAALMGLASRRTPR